MCVPSGLENPSCNSLMTRLDSLTENCFRNTESDKSGCELVVRRKRYDFHVVDVTKPMLSVSYLCENGVETHLAKQPFLTFGDGHEPLIRKSGVYFVKAQSVNALETMTQDESEKRCVRAEDSQIHRSDAYELKIHNIGAYELEIHKSQAYELMMNEDSQNRCVRAEDAQNQCVHPGGSQNRCVPRISVNSCVRPGDSTKSCMRAGNLRKSVRCVESQPCCERSF